MPSNQTHVIMHSTICHEAICCAAPSRPHDHPLNHPHSTTTVQCNSPMRYIASVLPRYPNPLPIPTQTQPSAPQFQQLTNIPAMLFRPKFNVANPVKLRTGSSVPVIAKHRTTTQTKQNPSQQTLTKPALSSGSHALKTRQQHSSGTRHAIRHM